MTPLYWRSLRNADLSAVTLVDVRTPDEFSLGGIPGAINIPLDDLRERLQEIPSDKPVYVYCGVGLRGYLASNILKQNGFSDVRNLIGGLKLYKSAMSPVPVPRDFCNSNSSHHPANPDDTLRSDVKHDVVKVDACGISCPGPILKLKNNMETLPEGAFLEITATDPGFARCASMVQNHRKSVCLKRFQRWNS